jgi:hypothetical protein
LSSPFIFSQEIFSSLKKLYHTPLKKSRISKKKQKKKGGLHEQAARVFYFSDNQYAIVV